MSGEMLRGVGLALMMLVGLGGCAAISSDAEFPPAQPPAAATHFKVTAPGSSRWTSTSPRGAKAT